MMRLLRGRRPALFLAVIGALGLGPITGLFSATERQAQASTAPTVESVGDPSEDCGAASTTPVIDGAPILVTLDPVTFTVGSIDPYVWRHPLRTDPGWRLWFEGFMY